MFQTIANKTVQSRGRGKHSVPTKPFPLNILPALALLPSTAAAGNPVLNSGSRQVTLLEFCTSRDGAPADDKDAR